MEDVASISQCRTAAAQCGLFTHKSVPVIFEPPCINIGIQGIDMQLHIDRFTTEDFVLLPATTFALQERDVHEPYQTMPAL